MVAGEEGKRVELRITNEELRIILKVGWWQGRKVEC